jgi:hypothetical protein
MDAEPKSNYERREATRKLAGVFDEILKSKE